MIVIELAGEPIGKGRPRFGQGRAYTPAKTRAYETALALAGKVAMRGKAVLDEPVAVTIIAYLPIPQSWNAEKKDQALRGDIRPTCRPDTTNIAKCEDGLNGIVWRDDALIVDSRTIKYYSTVPRLVVRVKTMDEFDGKVSLNDVND